MLESPQCTFRSYPYNVPLPAGEGPFRLSAPCWSCFGDYCLLRGDSASLGSPGTTCGITAVVSVPGGGQYRLLYRLFVGYSIPSLYRVNTSGLPSQSWQARITSIDHSFPAIVLESFTDFRGQSTNRELTFSLPEGTSVISLTFEASEVRQGPQGLRHYPMQSLLLS